MPISTKDARQAHPLFSIVKKINKHLPISQQLMYFNGAAPSRNLTVQTKGEIGICKGYSYDETLLILKGYLEAVKILKPIKK